MSDAYKKALSATGESDSGQVAKAGRWAIGEIERFSCEVKAVLDTVYGWRENDHPEWFCRRTAEWIADRVREAVSEEQPPDTCPECHGTGKTVINKHIGVEDCPECGRDSEEQ